MQLKGPTVLRGVLPLKMNAYVPPKVLRWSCKPNDAGLDFQVKWNNKDGTLIFYKVNVFSQSHHPRVEKWLSATYGQPSPDTNPIGTLILDFLQSPELRK